MSYPDHFSTVAAAYAAFRPHYPDALFAWLATVVPRQRLAWDCATGNGQAAVALAAHFDQVVATDASAAQIAEAAPHERVEYRVAPAARSGLADAEVDLVTVAQALHWFDADAFYAEATRVLAPSGAIAVWGYGLMETGDAAIDAIVRRLYAETLAPWWPPERRHVDAAYRTLPFPFDEIAAPAFHMERDLSLDALLGYVGTWSAVRRRREATGEDVLAPVREALAPRWGERTRRRVRWPLFMRVGRVAPRAGG